MIGFSVALVAAENTWSHAGRGRSVPVLAVVALALCAAVALGGRSAVGAVPLVGLAVFTACHFALLARTRRPARVRAMLAFAFGLVHGFGFAGVLAEMALPAERLAPALFGFNVGVEIGQIAVVAAAWPLLRMLRRIGDGSAHRWVVDAASAGICGLGIFWFVTRAFGGA
ncbi:MAG: HupE/UreJ family protein [Myxococcales bacterium]|nr:HupE/UreJ family protein [Myxococcales bacterium]